jgi:hypothetical protein
VRHGELRRTYVHEGDAEELTPEDIASLSVESLAARGEYLAVASVAMFGSPQDQSFAMTALNALAAKAEDPLAFAGGGGP